MEQAIIDIILEPMDLNFACILLLSSISRVQTSFGDLDFFFTPWPCLQQRCSFESA